MKTFLQRADIKQGLHSSQEVSCWGHTCHWQINRGLWGCNLWNIFVPSHWCKSSEVWNAIKRNRISWDSSHKRHLDSSHQKGKTICGRKALEDHFEPPSPCGHGWNIKDGALAIESTAKNLAPKVVLEIVSCKSCKKCNTRRCPCKTRGFQCTHSCGCGADRWEHYEDSVRYHALEIAEGEEDMDIKV